MTTKHYVRKKHVITSPEDEVTTYPSINKAKKASRELQKTGAKLRKA